MFASPDYRSLPGIITILTLGAVSEARDCTRISVSANTVRWGSPLFASCTVTNVSCFGDPIAHASQIIWRLDNRDLPRTQYTIVSKTVSQLIIPAFNQSAGVLSCRLHRGSPVTPQHGVRIYGGFPPEKPDNLTCVTTLKDRVSMTCSWNPGRDSRIPTKYTLRRIKNLAKCHNHETNAERGDCVSLDSRSCTVPRDKLRLFSTDDISVLAQNVLGTSESDTLCLDPMDAVKLERPVIPHVRGDPVNSHCLIIRWVLDMNLGMRCELGYRARHHQAWRQMLVPVNDRPREQSLCQLSAGTEYRVRLRCTVGSMGHWSDWSLESNGRTSESPPVGIPDVWWHFEDSDQDRKKYIRLFWKELKQSEVNGRIRGYRVIHRWEAQSRHTELTLCNTTNLTCRISAPTGMGNICITAYNSAGESPAAELGLKTLHHRAFALLSQSVSTTPINEHSLQIEWSAPRGPVTGYVVEWCEISGGAACDISWKKESADSISSVLQENIKPMKRYAISIYPLHSKGLGIPVSTEAYSKQGAPLIGPKVSGNHIWKSKAEVIWEEIPIDKRQGFIRNYTIFYSDKTGPIRYIVSNVLERRYTLTGLLAETDYQVQVMATTDAGGTNGSVMNLTTKKSDDGDMETLVASICALFLFLMSLLLLMCFIRRNVMTGNLWPKIPDPANSSLSSWIPETRHQDCKCSEGAPDSLVSTFTLLERGTDKNTAFAIKSIHLVEEEMKTSTNSDGKGPGGGESLGCLSKTQACFVDRLYHNVSGGSQYATVLHYKGRKTPPPFFLRSDSTQPLLHELTPSPKPFENLWFSKSAESDSEASQDISLSDVIVGEEAIWKTFPLLWGLVSDHSGDPMVTPAASFH